MQKQKISKISRILALPILAVALASLLPGCSQPTQPPPPDTITIDCPHVLLWQTCQNILKERGFQLDIVDRRHGIIQTLPRLTSQWFELPNKDVVGSENYLEANLQTVRRTVTVNIQSTNETSHSVNCRVLLERLTAQPNRVSGTVHARKVLVRAAGRMPGLKAHGKTQLTNPKWTTIANDNQLAADIITSIDTQL